jgi:DNA invertase Pin-like site-specific DNA recombinase
MRIGYSRISDERQAGTDPLAQAEHELRKAGCDLILVEVGSGTSDTARPQFKRLRELILDGQASEVICPSQDRLGRNLQLVLDFVQLCQMQGVKLLDLNGRELEVRTADGTLMTQLIGALDQHRSALYSEKTKRHLQAAREQGLPARPRVPFGLRKVRNDAGRFVGIDLDPITASLARQRIDWFLRDGLSLTKLCQRIAAEQPDHSMQMRQLRRWLESPLLTGRLAWHKDTDGRFTQVNAEPTFPALISDAEHDAIKTRLAAASTLQGVRGRTLRMFTGLVYCQDCKVAMTYKLSGQSTLYLRCSNALCPKRAKQIRADQVFQVLQYSLPEHARALLPLLQRPKVDSPEVIALQREIEQLTGISGAEGLIEVKRGEINRLRATDTETPAWLLIGALRSPMFWLQSDERLNQVLRLLVDRVMVQLGATVSDALVAEVRCRTNPSLAPLPRDQRDVRLRRGLGDVALAVHHEERVQALLRELG